MNRRKIEQIIGEALGEASVLFMSSKKRGVDMEMPSEELIKIITKTADRLSQQQPITEQK